MIKRTVLGAVRKLRANSKTPDGALGCCPIHIDETWPVNPALLLNTPPGKGRIDIVFAAESAKAAKGNAQRTTGVPIALVHPRHSLDLLPAKTLVHCHLLHRKAWWTHPIFSKVHAQELHIQQHVY